MVVGSLTVGPEAMTLRSLPGTSEKSRLATVAGCTTWARPPPLTLEICLRTVFISEIVAPALSRALLTAIIPSKSSDWGASNMAEPPPQVTTMTRSLSVRLPRASTTVWVKSRLAWEGSG